MEGMGFTTTIHYTPFNHGCFEYRYSLNLLRQVMGKNHCMKSVQRRSYFWSVFSCIRTEYGDLLRKSPYSVRIQENTDQK